MKRPSDDDIRKFLESRTPEQKHEMVQTVMADDEFNELLDEQFKLLTDSYRDNPENEEMLTIHLFGRPTPKDKLTRIMMLIPQGWPKERKKEEVQRAVGAKLALDNPDFNLVAGMATSEAWAVKSDKDEELPELPPSEHPDRIEVVVAAGMTIDGRTNWANWEIVRGKKGAKLKPEMYRPYIFGQDQSNENYMLQNIFTGYAEARRGKFFGEGEE